MICVLKNYMSKEQLVNAIASYFSGSYFSNQKKSERVSMGLTDRRKTAKNLADSRKKLKNFSH